MTGVLDRELLTRAGDDLAKAGSSARRRLVVSRVARSQVVGADVGLGSRPTDRREPAPRPGSGDLHALTVQDHDLRRQRVEHRVRFVQARLRRGELAVVALALTRCGLEEARSRKDYMHLGAGVRRRVSMPVTSLQPGERPPKM